MKIASSFTVRSIAAVRNRSWRSTTAKPHGLQLPKRRARRSIQVANALRRCLLPLRRNASRESVGDGSQAIPSRAVRSCARRTNIARSTIREPEGARRTVALRERPVPRIASTAPHHSPASARKAPVGPPSRVAALERQHGRVIGPPPSRAHEGASLACRESSGRPLTGRRRTSIILA